MTLLCTGRTMGATFDETRAYRYTLWRHWADTGGRVCWVMLNPSTADETVLDPTLRRCKGYAQEWGFGSMSIVNLYALRSTNPKALRDHPDPVGPGNDAAIVETLASASIVVLGWGANAKEDRAAAVLEMVRAVTQPMCLKVTAGGLPNHPLYLSKLRVPIPYNERLPAYGWCEP